MHLHEEHGRGARWLAWLWVVALHAGLFWLLTLQPPGRSGQASESRLRLVFIPPTPAAPAVTPGTLATRPVMQLLPARAAPKPALIAEPVAPAIEPAAAGADQPELASSPEAGVPWGNPKPRPDFSPDPLRSRRAQLPGGNAPERFRMRNPVSVASVLEGVAGAFGDPGPPCPRVQQRLAGLLTDTSDRGRTLLQEELRREQQFCRD